MPDVTLYSGPSKAYPPLAMWSPTPTERYSGSIVVFKSGGDMSPIQTAQLRLDKHIKHSEFPEAFSWRFPDGREETFEWKWSTHSGLPKVRDENEEMLGTGMKCFRKQTGKIVAAEVDTRHLKRHKFMGRRMVFFRWNMSDDMGDEFECMVFMTLVVKEQLYQRYTADYTPVQPRRTVTYPPYRTNWSR
jgi:hypothetical protein